MGEIRGVINTALRPTAERCAAIMMAISRGSR